ncbi:cell envelope integrity protein TolA [Neorhizobium petrolearium]|uniref:Cell envelope integrity protein TolA n=1 Tax=Neorhizobium petrolearium TaxID=515361 RepID=A0ABY8M182_9HYPH|nr:TonB family protein [Neorhizobium petrolearium]MCC2613186.1 cell envelope integrity protein TolA [Neorhizobium petrolearium]WGI68277.1 cell envelope integrity protein TolA [Neorhizobium petrolearium]
MSLVVSQAGPSGRAGELALWSVAGLLMLSVHIGAAALLMQETPDAPADNSPPAAIMIELAPEPEAVNTEEDQISPDQQDQEEVKSEQTEPAEEPQPEPAPEPTPEPVEPPQQQIAEPVEPTPAEPVIEQPPREMPEPEPQITRTIPEPPPEPVEEIDPIEEQMTAALENVEVPLPMMRPEPPKPDEAKKPEPRKEQAKRTQKPKQQQQQARQDMAEAKVQARQSDRTAASQNSAGFFSQSISPAKWKSRVQAKLARTARRCPGDGTGTAAVRFSFDGRGNVTSVSLSRSSGDSAIDSYIISAVRRASPIPAPPSGVASYLDQALTCL